MAFRLRHLLLLLRLCDDRHARQSRGLTGSVAHNLMTSLIFALQQLCLWDSL